MINKNKFPKQSTFIFSLLFIYVGVNIVLERRCPTLYYGVIDGIRALIVGSLITLSGLYSFFICLYNLSNKLNFKTSLKFIIGIIFFLVMPNIIILYLNKLPIKVVYIGSLIIYLIIGHLYYLHIIKTSESTKRKGCK